MTENSDSIHLGKISNKTNEIKNKKIKSPTNGKKNLTKSTANNIGKEKFNTDRVKSGKHSKTKSQQCLDDFNDNNSLFSFKTTNSKMIENNKKKVINNTKIKKKIEYDNSEDEKDKKTTKMKKTKSSEKRKNKK